MKDSDSRKSEKGLSLIEISIALIVVGLLVAPLIQMYNINKMERISRENNKGLENIAIALNKYAQQHKRYPIPANPTLTSSSVDYGASAAISPSAACSGIITGQGVRCTNGDGNVTSPLNEVLVGAVPFLELGLNEKDTFDIYGSKITYAVTRLLTDPTLVPVDPTDPDSITTTKFKDNEGAIGFKNQKNDPLNGGGEFNTRDASGKSRVLFALINHGANRSGAYQKDGSLALCSGQLDTDNCNRDASVSNGPNADGIFRGMQKYDPDNTPDGLLPELSKHVALGNSTESYDDTVLFRTSSRNEGWSSLRNSEDDAEAGTFLSQAGSVMLKSPDQTITPMASMDVNGPVQVYKTMSRTICNTDDADPDTDKCFRVKNIAAPEPDPVDLDGGYDQSVRCNDATALIGFDKVTNKNDSSIEYQKPQSKYFIKRKCPETSSAMAITNCPNGVSGISGGVPVCM